MTAQKQICPNKGENEQLNGGNERRKATCFEDILDDIGAFGHWQRVIFVLISFADVFAAMAIMLPVLTGAKPDWGCLENEAGEPFHESDIKNNISNRTWNEKCSFNSSKCVFFEFDSQFTSIVSEWSLVCDKAYASDLISSIQMVGLMFGAALFAQVSDSIGRRKTYFLVFTIMTAAGICSGFATSWQMYAALRVVTGIGFGGVMVVACVYPMEFVGTKWRVFCGTIGFWAVGIMCLAGLGIFLHDWKSLTLYSSIASLTFYLAAFFVPESPRWLIQKHRFEEAEQVLTKIAKRNKRTPPSMSDLVALAEQEGRDKKNMKKYSYLDILKHPVYRKRVVILFFCWFTTFLLYYELSYNLKNLSGDRIVNLFFSGLVDLASQLSVIILLSLMGRKYSLIGYAGVAVMSLVIIVIVIFTGNTDGSGMVIRVFALLGKSAALSTTYVVQIFTAELFPTVARNIGIGSGSIAGRIGGILAPQLVFLGEVSLIAPYIICMALFVIMVPLLLFLPETKGKNLEDKFDVGSQTSMNTTPKVI